MEEERSDNEQNNRPYIYESLRVREIYLEQREEHPVISWRRLGVNEGV